MSGFSAPSFWQQKMLAMLAVWIYEFTLVFVICQELFLQFQQQFRQFPPGYFTGCMCEKILRVQSGFLLITISKEKDMSEQNCRHQIEFSGLSAKIINSFNFILQWVNKAPFCSLSTSRRKNKLFLFSFGFSEILNILRVEPRVSCKHVFKLTCLSIDVAWPV